MSQEQTDHEQKATITLERRPDGGLRVYSEDIPGLVLSHTDPAKVMADILPAIETIGWPLGQTSPPKPETDANRILALQAELASMRERTIEELRQTFNEALGTGEVDMFNVYEILDRTLANPAEKKQ